LRSSNDSNDSNGSNDLPPSTDFVEVLQQIRRVRVDAVGTRPLEFFLAISA
jgi:hypothetical protein